MNIEIEITNVRGNELFRRYPGQTGAQPCHVLLDCRSGKLRAEYNPEIGNACTGDEYFGHTQAWPIPCLRERAGDAVRAGREPLADRVVGGYGSEWDGSNHLAVFTDDAQEAIEAIEALCNAADPTDGVRAWDAGDWLTASGSTRRDVVRRELGITAATTDEELGVLETRVEEEAVETGEADVLTGTREFLRGLREEAREED